MIFVPGFDLALKFNADLVFDICLKLNSSLGWGELFLCQGNSCQRMLQLPSTAPEVATATVSSATIRGISHHMPRTMYSIL